MSKPLLNTAERAKAAADRATLARITQGLRRLSLPFPRPSRLAASGAFARGADKAMFELLNKAASP